MKAKKNLLKLLRICTNKKDDYNEACKYALLENKKIIATDGKRMVVVKINTAVMNQEMEKNMLLDINNVGFPNGKQEIENMGVAGNIIPAIELEKSGIRYPDWKSVILNEEKFPKQIDISSYYLISAYPIDKLLMTIYQYHCFNHKHIVELSKIKGLIFKKLYLNLSDSYPIVRIDGKIEGYEFEYYFLCFKQK